MNKIQYLSIICLSSIAVLFCSCSKDDNPENKKEETNVQYTENDAKIVGTWTVEGNLSNNVTYTFYKEGSGVWSQIGENNILRFFNFIGRQVRMGKWPCEYLQCGTHFIMITTFLMGSLHWERQCSLLPMYWICMENGKLLTRNRNHHWTKETRNSTVSKSLIIKMCQAIRR